MDTTRGTVSFGGKSYEVDGRGYLCDHRQWDRGFAEAGARRAGIAQELTPAHWIVIDFIRAHFAQHGECPLVYQTCRGCGLTLGGLKKLFPTGYLRGACLLSGITYRDRRVNFFGEQAENLGPAGAATDWQRKTYRVDAFGFLVDPAEWDEGFAVNKAAELGMRALTAPHWEIIRYLRKVTQETGRVPTVFETCEANRIEIDRLEELFPSGFQRGAVKLAGLNVDA
jgi:tRNA 2-thiouridine synthesizing protein E